MQDESPLAAREVRNGSEHFDERLDEWIVHLPRPTLEDLQDSAITELLDLKLMAEELRRILARIETLEPSVAALSNPELAATLVSLPPVPVIPFDAPAQKPGGVEAWLDEQRRTDSPPPDRHPEPERHRSSCKE
ncbi:hypothetical protein [Streptomyces sp. NPDC007205]|uniref:hypothetical protein n=1 Tax=Streptomyces sp. NPDC007205 TaxID=3154316 RepID=UPI0033D9178C